MMYSKQKMARDDRGFVRYIGKDPQGKQVKFRLGDNQDKATLAKVKLEALWQRVSKEADRWDELTLTIAKAIARGANTVSLPPNTTDPMAYLNWIHRLDDRFGDLIQVLPDQPDLYRAGADKMYRARREFQSLVAEGLEHYRQLASQGEIPGTLHEALDAYIAYLKERENDHSGWARTKVKEAEILRAHHPDLPLARLNLQAMEDQLNFWAKRPTVRNKKNQPMSALSCRNYIKRLRDFWKWLHYSDKFAWRRPEGHEELKVRIASIPDDREDIIKTMHVETYSVEELTTLYRHATPLMRTFILLGLNCGFSIAEIATLSRTELFLKQPHPKLNLLGSWILRVRGKTKVYAEFKLWDATVQALEWALQRLDTIKPDSRTILLTADGNPFNAKTKSGNKSSRIPSLWKNLQRTVRKEQPGFRYLPFKQLRKIGGQLVKEASDGEVAGVFHARGKPVQSDVLSDVYTNRPFLKVFMALEEVGKKLQPMFQSVANPFPS